MNFKKIKYNSIMSEVAMFLLICLMLCVVALVPIGYILNIYKLVKCDFEPSYKAEIIRGVGAIAPPVGVIVGYIDIGK